MSSPVPNIFPCLRYEDAPAAIEWLCDAFGFTKQVAYPSLDGSIAHAQLTLGCGGIMLGSIKDDAYGTSPKLLSGISQSIYIFVADPDAHHARAKAHGAEIVRELVDTDYGSREYSCRDPEGHVWSFGTYLPEPGV